MKKVIAAVLFILMVFMMPLSLAGCGKSNVRPIFKDNSYVSVSLPGSDDAANCLLAVGNLAVQAHLSAMLKTEKFYRLCESKASAGDIVAALADCSEAWEAADVLSSSAYLMGKCLAQIERNGDHKNNKAGISDLKTPFMIDATAASAYRMEKFEDAKEWAEYITRIYDHAATGQKTSYVAKILKTDVNRAKKAVEMSQSILKGEQDLQAGYDNATYELLLKTKTVGKVTGFAAATIASAGSTMGLLGAAGYIAGGVDTAMEVTDTTLTLTVGENHQLTKTFQNTASKVAPIVSVVSFINVLNPEAWANGAIDAVGQYRYIADSAVDLVGSNKLFGIELPPLSEASSPLKVLTLPVGDEAAPKHKDTLKEALIDMGFEANVVESFVNAEPAQTETENAVETPFEELPPEEIERKIEEIPMSDADWESLFEEVYNDYIKEMKENGYIEEGDDIWDYDPFMPFEDFPQDGDEIGFDDLSMWAKPDMPGDGSEETLDTNKGGDVKTLDAKYWARTYDTVFTTDASDEVLQNLWVYVAWDEDAGQLKVTSPQNTVMTDYDPATCTARAVRTIDGVDCPVTITFSENDGVPHMVYRFEWIGVRTEVYEGDALN